MTLDLEPQQASPITPERPLDPHRLMRPKEASDLLAISPRMLWSLSASGEIPTVRIRTCVRYSSRDLVAWIQKHRVARR